MSFEGEPRGEQHELRTTIKAVESGEVPEDERRSIRHLKGQGVRYGQAFAVNNFDGQSGKSLTVLDNLNRMNTTIEGRIGELQNTANGEALRNLPPEEQQKYHELIHMTPQQRAVHGEGWRQPEDMLNAPDVQDMPEDDLKNLMEVNDAERAEMMMHCNFNPYTGERMGHMKWNAAIPDVSMEKLMDLTTKVTRDRHTIQEAMTLQMEEPGLISHRFGQTAQEYLEEVKKKLG